MPSISQGFGDVRSYQPWWILGQKYEASGNDEVRDAINNAGQVEEVTTFVVTDPGDNTDVTVSIGTDTASAVAVTVNTSTGLAAPAIATLLTAAIEAEPLVKAWVSATVNSATITLTGRWPGRSFVVLDTTPASIGSITEVTAAASAATVPFGRAVIRTGRQNIDELCSLALGTRLSFQVQTITIPFVNSSVLHAEVFEVRDGEEHKIGEAQFTSATDADTTIDGLVAILNANLAATGGGVVVATADASTATAMVLTSAKRGLEFRGTVKRLSGGASDPAITSANTTGPSQSTSLHRALIGVSLRSNDVSASTIGGSEQEYPANSTVSCLRRGAVVVESAQTIADGDSVYVELASGSDTGKFFNTSSSTRVQLARSKAYWIQDANTGTGSLAALRLML